MTARDRTLDAAELSTLSQALHAAEDAYRAALQKRADKAATARADDANDDRLAGYDSALK